MHQSKLRYGIIGFGNFAERAILPAIQASHNSEVVAIQKRNQAEAEVKARQYGIPFAFSSTEELVHCADVDAVFIVAANSQHCAETLLASKANKHVLVEKPMAMNVAEAQRMIDVCKQNNVKLMVGYMLRFSPLLIRMRELVREGHLGKIISARSEFVYDASLSKRTWLFDRKIAGGGPTFDIAVHCFDSLRFILDDEIISTQAMLNPQPTETRTEVSSLLSLQFAKGHSASVFTSFEVPVRKTLLEITGRKGILSVENFTVSNVTADLVIEMGEEGTSQSKTTEHIIVPNLYTEEVSHFTDAIRADTEPQCGGENGLRNQQVLEEAFKI